jgi:mannose-6-phosphate isomerase-like protein (cupin superfamily)
MFSTKHLPEQKDAIAPDGSHVRVLLQVSGGSLAHFELAPEQTSVAIRHRTVEEIWYIVSGYGQMWRKSGTAEEVTHLEGGVCVTIPLDTHFQFRSVGEQPLVAIGVTMPPWPGDGEAIRSPGQWKATVDPGAGLTER